MDSERLGALLVSRLWKHTNMVLESGAILTMNMNQVSEQGGCDG